MSKTYFSDSIEVGGKQLTFEMGKMAKQADGAVVVRYGDTMLLVTAVSSRIAKENASFFPLTVDYRENNYAAGRIPGNYFRREGRPTEKEILTSRLIDRPLRPLFPESYRCETQVMATVISADTEHDPDIFGITGASAALYLSDIPFFTPIAGVRVGIVNGGYVVNPTYEQTRKSVLNLTVAGSEEALVMVEAGAKEVDESVMVEALVFAHQEIKRICAWQKQLGERLAILKRTLQKPVLDPKILEEVETKYLTELHAALDVTQKSKLESYATIDALKERVIGDYPEDQPEQRAMAGEVFDHLKEKVFRDDILNHKRRPDGRRFTEIRALDCEIGFLPRVHGSALFTRGETQALVTATLGTSEDIQYLDNLETGEIERRFMLNYNFPPYSVGEVGRSGSPGRREIGHGALARRALEPMLPAEDTWPYILRLVSDITESNGSSSMATVCGGSLALMDAGVPVKSHVAGIAMGLVMGEDRYAILTDIAGAEDHYGDMDFKVSGTRSGITGLQMDIKVTGVDAQVLAEALSQAREARMILLDKMEASIANHRGEVSRYAPRIFTIQIPVDKIRDVIGPGGKIIRGIVDRTGCKIDVQDDGRINVAATSSEAAEKALQIIKDLTAEAEVGKTYLGRVTRLTEFGAFVEIFPGTEALLHISEAAEHRVRDMHEIVKEGDQIRVKCIATDGQGKIRLSRKAVLREDRGEPPEEVPARPHRAMGPGRRPERTRRAGGGGGRHR